MPTYQYACTECEHRFEQVQAFSDASLTQCPVCGGKLRKVYGSVGVVFKGSGFYRTDSRSGAANPASGGEKSESSTPDTGKGAPKEAAASTSTFGDSGPSGSAPAKTGAAAGAKPAANGSSASSKPAAAAKSSG